MGFYFSPDELAELSHYTQVHKSMASVQKTTGTLGIAFSSMVKSMFGIGTAIAAVGTGIKVAGQALNAFNAQVMALKEVQAVLNSTGRASEFTAQGLNGLAGERQPDNGATHDRRC